MLKEPKDKHYCYGRVHDFPTNQQRCCCGLYTRQELGSKMTKRAVCLIAKDQTCND